LQLKEFYNNTAHSSADNCKFCLFVLGLVNWLFTNQEIH
jgi:hypothetical protein